MQSKENQEWEIEVMKGGASRRKKGNREMRAKVHVFPWGE